MLQILFSVAFVHLLNDCVQAVLPSIYPLLKHEFALTFTQVGLITLVGLVSKNGILIVEFANHLQEQGADKLRAVVEAASTRLRPILMTTAATVVGHFPLILATGPGAGARNSIGIMLVSGMIIGTVFTLFVVPSIYVLVARTRVAEAGEQTVPGLAEAAV